jgi:hypothetical protein
VALEWGLEDLQVKKMKLIATKCRQKMFPMGLLATEEVSQIS